GAGGRRERQNGGAEVRRAAAAGKNAEPRGATRRDGDGDGEDVVDGQRRAAHHSCARPEQAGGDDVTAAAEGEVLDDAAVGGRDDEDRERGRCGKEDGEIRVLAQVLERVLRAVCGRLEA